MPNAPDQKTCAQCSQSFTITAEDQNICNDFSPTVNGKKYQLPLPTMCHPCRARRRLAFRNERSLYNATCGLCKKKTVSIYDPQKGFKIYCPDCFWGDGWDGKDYGRDFDFSRPLHEQMKDLQKEVPHLGNSVVRSVNCDFNSFAVDSKDCFQSLRLAKSEKIFFSYLCIGSTECTDVHNCHGCQFCYECVDCQNCYNTKWSQMCKDSSDLLFCYDCVGSRNCFGSFGLRNAEYHFFNKKCSKEEYEKLLKEYDLSKTENIEKAKKEFTEKLKTYPRRQNSNINVENVTGDWITNSKNVHQSFEVEKSEDVAWSSGVDNSKTIYDTNFTWEAERSYENISIMGSVNAIFNFMPWTCHNVMYCTECFNNSQNCFASISLKKSEYCILNKQYTKEEYEKLVPKIIEHMIQTGEWGNFLNPQLSGFGYNESVASEYMPFTKEEATKQGFTWWEPPESPKTNEPTSTTTSSAKAIPASTLPSAIVQVQDDILQTPIECEVTKRPFKVTKQELEFYRKQNIPLPRRHPDQRYNDRLALRNPRQLFPRKCAKCQTDIQTTYSPNRPEPVYCEACYLKAVY